MDYNVDSPSITGLSLCAGLGGLDYGLEIAVPGYQSVCYVERQGFAQAVLVARMEDSSLGQAPIWSDIKSFDGKPWRGKVHILSAGYPCQPFSIAGKQQAEDDPRHLWPDVRRIIAEVAPPIVFLENVVNHIRLGFIEVRKDLREMGYRVEAGIYSAEETLAPHRRERLFVVAYRDCDGCKVFGRGGLLDRQWTALWNNADRRDTFMGHSDSKRLEGWTELNAVRAHEWDAWPPSSEERARWETIIERCPRLAPATQSQFCRMVDGFTHTSDPTLYWTQRLTALGNAVVPIQAAWAFIDLITRMARRQT